MASPLDSPKRDILRCVVGWCRLLTIVDTVRSGFCTAILLWAKYRELSTQF